MGSLIKFFLISIIILIFLPRFSCAQVIKVNIRDKLESEITTIKYNSLLESGEPFKVNFELFNSGSIGYRVRIRLNIMNDTEIYYTGWSEEKPLWPGNSGNFELYWYPMNLTGNLEAKLLVYYANEIEELKSIDFKISSTSNPEKDIDITDLKTYEDRVIVTLKTDQELEDVIIIPSDYPYGWIFEQSKIDLINAGKEKKVELKYEPTIWKETETMIHVFTEDGKHYNSKSFLMEREESRINILSFFIKIFKIFSTTSIF